MENFMKKGILVVMILVLLGGVCLSAQTTPAAAANKKNYVFVDFAPLLAGVLLEGFGVGGGYERALTNYFSVVGYFDYLAVKDAAAFDVLLRPRVYTSGTALSGFYIGGIIGYGMVIGGEGMVSFGAEAGWKYITASGLSAEPWLGFVTGEYGGLKYGVTFGYAW
jgi:hypothetical protein